MTDPHSTIVAGTLSMLRAERDDLDAAIRALERLQRRRAEALEDVTPEHADPPEREPEPAADAESWPARILSVAREIPGDWSLDDAAFAFAAHGWDRGLRGQDLKDRISGFLGRVEGVERTARGRYRLAVKAGTNGGSEPTDPAAAPIPASPR